MTKQSLAKLAKILGDSERGAQIARGLGNTQTLTYGEITDIDDPEEQGRVKVTLDEVNAEILTEDGFEQDGEPTKTDWISPLVPFKGKQPEDLIGKRVPIHFRNSDPNRPTFGDPVYDPGETEKAEEPKNSAMTRLPVYPAGSLPPASEENVGCMVIEQDGPMENDWLCVCLKRSGDYYWVRHIDLAHGHAGENDGKQPPDSGGDYQRQVEEQSVWDYVFPTTGGEMQKYSAYGTKPRANPYGEKAKWYEPPESGGGEGAPEGEKVDDFNPGITRPPNLPGF